MKLFKFKKNIQHSKTNTVLAILRIKTDYGIVEKY